MIAIDLNSTTISRIESLIKEIEETYILSLKAPARPRYGEVHSHLYDLKEELAGYVVVIPDLVARIRLLENLITSWKDGTPDYVRIKESN